MLSPITTEPPQISPADHATLTSSTPASFSSIPPILRYKLEEVTVSFSPAWEGLGSEGPVQGKAWVTEEALSFLPTSGGQGFTLSYPAITLHAISRENNQPAIYIQLDDPSVPVEQQEGDTEEFSPMRELRIFVKEEQLEPTFLALSSCAALHPSAFDTVDGLDNSDAWEAGANHNWDLGVGAGMDEDDELSEVGRAAMAHLDSILVWPSDIPGNPEAVEDEEAETVEEETKGDPKAQINGN